MQFSDLGLIDPLLRALRDAGYHSPSPIQEKAIPPVLARRDLLGCAQTGTGKTAAFALPLLQLMQQSPAPGGGRPIRALVLTPTRELAAQIQESFESYGKYLRLRSVVIFGGVGQQPQVDALRRGADVLVATPGRLLDLCGQGLVSLDRLEFFVLDEADRMLDMGFIHDIRRVIKMLPARRQTLFFSATMPDEIRALSDTLLHDPAHVMVAPVSSTVDSIVQSVLFTDKPNKRDLLLWAVRDPEVTSALVFTRTKHLADRVARYLKQNGVSADSIHGDKTQGARLRALGDFKSGKCRVLVATDIAARGIDVTGISHVFNFDLPDVPETYVHRIGRTGRAGRDGIAVSFCTPEEVADLRAIEKLIRKPVPVVADHPYPCTGDLAAPAPAAPARQGAKAPRQPRQAAPQRPARQAQPQQKQPSAPRPPRQPQQQRQPAPVKAAALPQRQPRPQAAAQPQPQAGQSAAQSFDPQPAPAAETRPAQPAVAAPAPAAPARQGAKAPRQPRQAAPQRPARQAQPQQKQPSAPRPPRQPQQQRQPAPVKAAALPQRQPRPQAAAQPQPQAGQSAAQSFDPQPAPAAETRPAQPAVAAPAAPVQPAPAQEDSFRAIDLDAFRDTPRTAPPLPRSGFSSDFSLPGRVAARSGSGSRGPEGSAPRAEQPAQPARRPQQEPRPAHRPKANAQGGRPAPAHQQDHPTQAPAAPQHRPHPQGTGSRPAQSRGGAHGRPGRDPVWIPMNDQPIITRHQSYFETHDTAPAQAEKPAADAPRHKRRRRPRGGKAPQTGGQA